MVTPGSRSGSSTALHEEYSMWVMPISGFIELDKLQPHQILRAPNKIVPYNESMSTVFFLSHQCVLCRVVSHARVSHKTIDTHPIPCFRQVDRF